MTDLCSLDDQPCEREECLGCPRNVHTEECTKNASQTAIDGIERVCNCTGEPIILRKMKDADDIGYTVPVKE